MTVTVSTPFTIPTPAAEDRLVRQYAEKRQALEGKLVDAQGRIAALKDERQALQEAAHHRRVNRLLGCVVGEEENTSRLAQIGDEITEATVTAVAVTDALELHEIVATGARKQAQDRCDEEVRTAARLVLAKMAGHAPELLELTEQLQQLVNLAPGLRLQTPPEMFLRQWLEAVRRLQAGYQ